MAGRSTPDAINVRTFSLLTRKCLSNGKLAGVGSPSLSIMTANGRKMSLRKPNE